MRIAYTHGDCQAAPQQHVAAAQSMTRTQSMTRSKMQRKAGHVRMQRRSIISRSNLCYHGRANSHRGPVHHVDFFASCKHKSSFFCSVRRPAGGSARGTHPPPCYRPHVLVLLSLVVTPPAHPPTWGWRPGLCIQLAARHFITNAEHGSLHHAIDADQSGQCAVQRRTPSLLQPPTYY